MTLASAIDFLVTFSRPYGRAYATVLRASACRLY